MPIGLVRRRLAKALQCSRGHSSTACRGLPSNGQNPRWKGSLVTDNFSGYNAGFELGVTQVGWTTHARRKFPRPWVDHDSHLHERIGPIAIGGSNWLFAQSLRAGRRVATIMSLVHSA